MNRRRADAAVGLIITAILVLGGILSWQAYQQQRMFSQAMPMMGSSMGSIHGTNPLWSVLGTVVAAGVIAGVYFTIRPDLSNPSVSDQQPATTPGSSATEADEPAVNSHSTGSIDPASQSRARVLDLLPEDERRILEPVITSPGITQIELRDRSDFSKSKVSQTVTDLEKRGLLLRERQGRTYRVYPSDDLHESK